MFRDYAFKTDTIFLSSQWVNWMSCFFRFLATKSSVILSKCEWVGDRPSTFWWRPQPEQVTSSPWFAGQHWSQPWWESQITLKLTLSMLNCLAEIGYEKIHQHLLSFLDTDMVQIVQFFPRGRQGPVYHTLSIPFLLVTKGARASVVMMLVNLVCSPRIFQSLYEEIEWISAEGI